MAYKGDTAAKKWVRLEAWLNVLEVLGKKRFYSGSHAFLCGEHASDARVLTGLGVPMENLLGIDHDLSAVIAARHRFPELRVEFIDVLDHLAVPRQYDSIALDFCAQLGGKNLDTAARAVLAGLKANGVITMTFLAGREQEQQGEIHSLVTRMRQRMQAQFKQMSKERKKYWEPMLPALSRFFVLQRALVERTRTRCRVPVPVALYFYKSRLPGETKGMPMCVYVAQVKACSRMAGDKDLTEALEKEPEFYFVDPDSMMLGKRAAVLESEGHDACALFDVTKRELAAWKAHATRRDE